MKMAQKSKVQELTDILKDLEATTPDIEASAVVSVDGLMTASALPQDVPCRNMQMTYRRTFLQEWIHLTLR
jgi:hypothetical protein